MSMRARWSSKLGEGEDVGQQPLRERKAPGTDESYLCHATLRVAELLACRDVRYQSPIRLFVDQAATR